jgi:hypothetical protein
VTGHEYDDELLQLLQSRDPAASLPPADPALVARLLEDAMNPDVDTPRTPGRTPARAASPQDADPRRRTPLTWLVAAAAVLVIAGVGAFALFWGEDQPTVPTAKDPAPSVLHLGTHGGAAGKCAVPTAALLANQQTAFDGTVTSIEDRTVTLEVGHWYRGGDADLVTVQAPPEELQQLLLAADFQQGGRYLVAANDGYVTVCGLTAPYSDDLAALYAEAFGA